MPRLPIISGKKAVKALKKAGWKVDHQTGSHIIMQKPGAFLTLSIPNHKELDRGLLRGLIKDAGLTVTEFTELL